MGINTTASYNYTRLRDKGGKAIWEDTGCPLSLMRQVWLSTWRDSESHRRYIFGCFWWGLPRRGDTPWMHRLRWDWTESRKQMDHRHPSSVALLADSALTMTHDHVLHAPAATARAAPTNTMDCALNPEAQVTLLFLKLLWSSNLSRPWEKPRWLQHILWEHIDPQNWASQYGCQRARRLPPSGSN